jgi:hypothetical protein
VSALAVRQLCRRLAVVGVVVVLLYVGFAAVASILPDVEHAAGSDWWPSFLPGWPVTFLLALAAVFVVADAVLWVASSSSSRSERDRLQALASGWRQRADAKMAAAKGDQDLSLASFRAQSLPGGARLGWGTPARTYDRVLVLRSRTHYALSPQTGSDQAVAYEGEENGFVDQGLSPDTVYFYTGFAEARGAGQWSPPAWASVTTPPAGLGGVSLRRIWTLRG